MKAIVLLLLFSALNLYADDERNQSVLKLKDPEAALRDTQWYPSQAIAIGDFYSVAFLTKSAHPFLAEYYQRVFLFGGSARAGDFLQAFQLQMNTGGRTHMLLYRYIDEQGRVQFITFQDRYGEQSINIPKREFRSEKPLPTNLKKEFIGTFSGEAPPNKFLTPLVMPEPEATKQLK